MIAIAWIIFVAVILGVVGFCTIIVKYYQEKREAEYLPTIVAVVGLTLTLLCVFLIPVDIYNASSSSNAKGEMELSPDVIESRGDSLRILYYVLYGLVLAFCFGIIPFAYFYYEEYDEDVTIGQRIWGGCKYTIFLVIMVVIMMVVGLILYFVKPGDKPANTDDAKKLVMGIVGKENFAESAVSFAIACLTLIGYVCFLTYTAYGLSVFPISIIRGRKHAAEESSTIRNDLEKAQKEQKDIQSKYLSGSKKMSKRDESKVSLLKRKERALHRQHTRLEGTQTWYRHIWTIIRPFMFIFGFLFILVSLLMIVAVILTSADRALNAAKFCGAACGYVLSYPKIFNPIDWVLTQSSKFFPLDYIIICLIIFYFFFATMSGISHIGIRFLWIKLFVVKRAGTPPQGLLFMAAILMVCLLALNMEVTTLAPQYATFGSQVFYNTTTNATQSCNLDAPPGNCTMTQIGTIINRINIATSFFGVIFYFVQWVFVLCFLIGSIVSCVKARSSNIERYEGDSDEDEDF